MSGRSRTQTVLVLVTLVLLSGVPSLWSQENQEVPRAEVFAGYSYLSLDTDGTPGRKGANGWETSISGNLDRRYAMEADFNGHYTTYPLIAGIVNIGASDYSYSAGPRINFRPFFVHFLLGRDRLTVNTLGTSASQDGFSGTFGGGVQWKLNSRMSFRTSADYVYARHDIFGGSQFLQNNIRLSSGLVFALGGRSPTRAR
jgi:hypothetical protein